MGMNESAPPPYQKRRQYLLGLGFGLIPLLIFLVATGFSYRAALGSPQLEAALTFLFVSLLLYFIALIATIAYLVNPQQRFGGYGLLTALLASPIIGAIACVASVSIH